MIVIVNKLYEFTPEMAGRIARYFSVTEEKFDVIELGWVLKIQQRNYKRWIRENLAKRKTVWITYDIEALLLTLCYAVDRKLRTRLLHERDKIGVWVMLPRGSIMRFDDKVFM